MLTSKHTAPACRSRLQSFPYVLAQRSRSLAGWAASNDLAPGSTDKNRYRVSLFDALKFNGPAPEIVNGRLAMLGLLGTASAEAATGDTALTLLQHITLGQAAGVLLVVYASMVPILKGARSEPFGIFTPRAEVTNARMAMLGYAALMFLEYKAGVPFF